jgi:hypothetical protein
MGHAIKVRDAHIKTAAVEIKSLTVSGKQVTMGVFRQLQVEDVIDPWEPQLEGVPWGTVNYFPKPCEPDHLHVVWQKGDELRRACVFPPPAKYILKRLADGVLEERDAVGLADSGFSPLFDLVHSDDPTELRRWVEAYRQHYTELQALGQLFIAV